MLFSRVKTGYLDKKFSKSLMRTETSLGRNNRRSDRLITVYEN